MEEIERKTDEDPLERHTKLSLDTLALNDFGEEIPSFLVWKRWLSDVLDLIKLIRRLI